MRSFSEERRRWKVREALGSCVVDLESGDGLVGGIFISGLVSVIFHDLVSGEVDIRYLAWLVRLII